MSTGHTYTRRVPGFEPPLVEMGATTPPPRSTSPVDRTGLHGRRHGPHSGRSPRPARLAAPPASQEAAAFADHTLRLVLEVIDRRRPSHLLGGSVDGSVIGMVAAMSAGTVPGRRLGTAILRRVHVREAPQPAPRRGGGRGCAEIFGTYSRGPRVFAVAARMERNRDGWSITALRMS